MGNEQVWQDCVKAIISGLRESSDAAAREIGQVWDWAFALLEKEPSQFNSLQDEDTQADLVRRFLMTCEDRVRGADASDRSFVSYVAGKCLSLSDIPKSRRPSKEIADALAAFGMFFEYDGNTAIDSPGRFAYTSALFALPVQRLADVLATKRIPEGQADILLTVAKHFPTGDKEREYFRRCEAAANIERFFGFSKRLLSSTDVYQRGYEFYRESSKGIPGNTLTLSNTSGLWNPHERLGTKEFTRRYGMNEGAGLKYKDGFRETNFTNGILNSELSCRRIYLFNEGLTWQGFAKARQAAKKKRAFDRDAAQFVDEVCCRMDASSGGLQLVAVKNWNTFPALALVTRISKNVVMFSNRGSDLAISHAFWCSLDDDGKIRDKGMTASSRLVGNVLDMAASGTLKALAPLGEFLERCLRKSDRLSMAIDAAAPERMRRLLDEEPLPLLRRLEEHFDLKLDCLNAASLREGLGRAKTESPI